MTLQSNFEEPLLFRSGDRVVHDSAINDGSLRMKSIHFYRGIENDAARVDGHEGINTTPFTFPLRFDRNISNISEITGGGRIGCEIRNAYILSLHGTGIDPSIREGFGAYMFGIKSLYSLVNEIIYQASRQVEVIGHSYGQVSYQYTPLTISKNGMNTAIELSKGIYLKSIATEILRKDPILPFIKQDEWRIAIFVKDYINNDAAESLFINVDKRHFYSYNI
jgi:hypothetical protein